MKYLLVCLSLKRLTYKYGYFNSLLSTQPVLNHLRHVLMHAMHVMAQIFKSGGCYLSLISSFDSISGGYIYLKVQTQFHCPLYHIYPKYSDTASIVNQNQTAPKDYSRSALFASAFIKHSLIPQKNLFKLY